MSQTPQKVYFTLPRWAMVFDAVQSCVRRIQGPDSGSAKTVKIVFGDGVSDEDQERQTAFRQFLKSAKISHDITAITFDKNDYKERCEKHRFEIVERRGIEQFKCESVGWTPGEDDALTLGNLHEMLEDRDPRAIRNFILSKAKDCGLTMFAVDKIPSPNESLMFTMAFMANDFLLVKKTSKPETVSLPMRATASQVTALWEAVRDENTAMACLLLQLGAKVDVPCYAATNATIANACKDPEQEVSSEIADLIMVAGAHQAARRALTEKDAAVTTPKQTSAHH